MVKKTILVSGGSAGIGRALAEILIKEYDCHVIITSRSEARGMKTVQEIGGSDIEFIVMDTTDGESVARAAEQLRRRDVSLFALVNNAGVGLQNVIDMPLTDLQKTKLIVDTNFTGVLRVTEAVLDLIEANGRVVNVSSGLGGAWLRTRDDRTKRLFSGTGNDDDDILTLDALEAAVEDAIATADNENDLFGSLGKLGYGLSKAAVTALTLLHSRQHPNLVFASLTPGFVRTAMTAGRDAPLSPVEGCRSLRSCLFGETIVSGAYYGADGKRSPLVVRRDAGFPEYQGEDNPKPEMYSNGDGAGFRSPRIAILGFMLESHAWAEPCGEEEFRAYGWFEGKEIADEARSEYSAISAEIVGFYRTMDTLYGGPTDRWDDEPIIFVTTEPTGPVKEEFFAELLSRVEKGLAACPKLDGVYICNHGGSAATHDDDSDGLYFQTVRNVVGPNVPIVSTLDLHSNISSLMEESVDVIVGYKTYPHIDMLECGEEAARIMEEMLAPTSMRPSVSRIKLPILAPNVTQVTATGPYGDLIRLGQVIAREDPDVLSISVLSGYEFGDSSKVGMTILVYTRGTNAAMQSKAEKTCSNLAQKGWDDRFRYVERLKSLSSLEDATAMAKAVGEDESMPSLLFGDVADGPGGGARGNTVYILKAFIDAGVKNCIIAVFNDAPAVVKCASAGVGSSITLTLNSEEEDPKSEKLIVSGVVVALSNDGCFQGKYGMTKGTKGSLGPSAALKIGGIILVIISKRTQCLSADQIEFIGLDPSAARSVVVKSEVHYRAGFAHIFDSDHIIEVLAPGLTSPDHTTFAFTRTPRPIFPLDGDKCTWTPPSW